MDGEARELAERCWPHVPTALLAHLWRAGEPFPVNTEPQGTLGPRDVTDRFPWVSGCVLDGGHIRFDCADCGSIMFQPYTDRGVRHAQIVLAAHKPDCCAERKTRFEQTGVPPVWPDRLAE